MKQEKMKIVAQKELAAAIYQLTLKGDLVQAMTKPGQFLHIKIPRADLLLRRPISLNQINRQANTCTLIYRVQGAGTQALSQLRVGQSLDVLGPLGNGFDSRFLKAGDTAFVIGGGIGIPPLYALSQQLQTQGVIVQHFLGYQTQAQAFFTQEFQQLGATFVATEDGTLGVKGNVLDLLPAATHAPTAVFACGASGMLRAVARHYAQHPQVFLSVEQRMACGIGACYACVCHVPNAPEKSVRVCDQGPVFRANEVCL